MIVGDNIANSCQKKQCIKIAFFIKKDKTTDPSHVNLHITMHGKNGFVEIFKNLKYFMNLARQI